ncbi:MAG TPA: hypothetical protein EYP11_05375 [Aquificaceae bacterium]|nr:hypothetical protein [Aquificaceae bacterium]HIQ31754.1 hypothetical protein [Aquifex aeolicus]
MRFALALSYITLLESLRKRTFYGVFGTLCVFLFLSSALAGFSLQDNLKPIVDMGYSSLSLVMVVATLFLSTDIMGEDLRRGGIYTVLSVGVSRSVYIFARALSLFTVVLLLTAVLGGTFLLFLSLVAGVGSLPAGLLALSVLAFKMWVLSCIVLFLSSFLKNFFLVFLGGVAVYWAGSSIESLYYFVSMEEELPPYGKLSVKVLFFLLPSFSSIGPDVILGLEKVEPLPTVLDLIKALFYALSLILGASLIFEKRELG